MRTLPSRYLRWIQQEISVLTESGVLDSDTAKRMRDYYAQQTTEKGVSSWAVSLFSIIGSLLIGGGIILLFAHNWAMLSRPARTVLSLLPLAIGAVLSLIAVTQHRKTAFREGAGLFHVLAFGSAIALIGQTYHLPSDVPAFMLTWALLIAPLMFLLPSVCVYLVYLALITAWTGAAQNSYQQALGYWPLLIPAGLFLSRLYRRDRNGPTTVLSIYGILFSLTIGLGIVMERTLPGLWTVAYAGLLASAFLLGQTRFNHADGWNGPLRLFGIVGIALLAYLFTWTSFWEDIGWRHCRTDMRYQQWGIWIDTAITMILLIIWALLAVNSKRLWRNSASLFSAFPLLAALGFLLGSTTESAEIVNALIFNGYVLLLGVVSIVFGAKHLRLRELNGGMFMVSALIVTRFFDSDFGFLARGITFIILGIGFLGTNMVMARRRRREVTE